MARNATINTSLDTLVHILEAADNKGKTERQLARELGIGEGSVKVYCSKAGKAHGIKIKSYVGPRNARYYYIAKDHKPAPRQANNASKAVKAPSSATEAPDNVCLASAREDFYKAREAYQAALQAELDRLCA